MINCLSSSSKLAIQRRLRECEKVLGVVSERRWRKWGPRWRHCGGVAEASREVLSGMNSDIKYVAGVGRGREAGEERGQ